MLGYAWGANQDLAYSMLKNEITKPAVLSLYDPAADMKISADASSYGLGAVFLQKQKTKTTGNLWHLHRDQCLTPKSVTCKLKRRH